MSKITGIGGVFLHFKGEIQELHDWYENVFSLDMTPYGTGFIEGDQLTLVSFKRSNPETTPQINFRVEEIEQCLKQVVQNGGKVTAEVQEYPYGKFAQFADPFDNIVELWEPYENEYKKMVKQEIMNYKKNKSTE